MSGELSEAEKAWRMLREERKSKYGQTAAALRECVPVKATRRGVAQDLKHPGRILWLRIVHTFASKFDEDSQFNRNEFFSRCGLTNEERDPRFREPPPSLDDLLK